MKQYLFQQHGNVITLLAILIVILIGICGLSLDLWRHFLISKQLQEATDSATLAGLNQLRTQGCNSCYPTNDVGWKNVKKAVAAAFANNNINGIDQTAVSALQSQTFRFLSGNKTYNDFQNEYDHETGFAGNLRIKVTRGVVCYVIKSDSSKTFYERKWFSLEDFPNSYCRANAVYLETSIDKIKTFFAPVWQLLLLPQVNVRSRAERNIPNTCGQDLCSSLGLLDPGNQIFTPFPCLNKNS